MLQFKNLLPILVLLAVFSAVVAMAVGVAIARDCGGATCGFTPCQCDRIAAEEDREDAVGYKTPGSADDGGQKATANTCLTNVEENEMTDAGQAKSDADTVKAACEQEGATQAQLEDGQDEYDEGEVDETAGDTELGSTGFDLDMSQGNTSMTSGDTNYNAASYLAAEGDYESALGSYILAEVHCTAAALDYSNAETHFMAAEAEWADLYETLAGECFYCGMDPCECGKK